ncbi:phage tail tube protein [Sphingomonas melonis]|jgi:predicted secreted protein|uniref:phage tail tube protein n=1 Tax=Sphingomonas melonis TaxID=152682 RepID=UPI0003657825|nr:phage tail tube protein [Sphingomonas melonis]ATI54169.1 hypothetical protein CP552_00155 [Sphingomonas melonis]
MATTTSPIISTGTLFKVKVGSTFTNVKGFTDFSGLGGGTATVVDVTDLSSTRKEKLVGLADEGQIKVSLNYIPDDAGQVALEAARDGAAKTSFQIVLPDATQFAFDGFVLAIDKAVGVDKQVTASVSIEITGTVVKSKAA